MQLLDTQILNMLNDDCPLHTVRTLQGERGNRSGLYIFVKTSRKKIKVYDGDVALYYTHRNPQKMETPLIVITPDRVRFNNRACRSSWSHGISEQYISHDVKSLINIGMLQGIHLRFQRLHSMLKCWNDDFVCIAPFTLDFNGHLVSRLSKEQKRLTAECIQHNKDQNNANARARYQNTAAVKRYRAALESQDWSKVPMDDIFRHQNVEYRTKLIEQFGMDNVIDSLEYAVLDTDVIDGRAYELLAVDLPTITNEVTHRACNYLKMINPSTGEVCLEGVPDVLAGRQDRWNMAEPTVKCALAWRDDDDWFEITNKDKQAWQSPEYSVDSNDKKIVLGYNKPIILT